jgi:hypothetical protein
MSTKKQKSKAGETQPNRPSHMPESKAEAINEPCPIRGN